MSSKMFAGTPKGVALKWFTNLPTRSIGNFEDLLYRFISRFFVHKAKQMEIADLFDIKQRSGETLKSYLARFNNATAQVEETDKKFSVHAFLKSSFLRLFIERPSSDATDLARGDKDKGREEYRSRRGCGRQMRQRGEAERFKETWREEFLKRPDSRKLVEDFKFNSEACWNKP